MAYVRKTVDRWDIETNYGYGWEVEDCEYTRAGKGTRTNKFLLTGARVYRLSLILAIIITAPPWLIWGDILQQSERERAQYTEEQAERLLTHLIYQELVKGAAGR